jgi:hypothetical protein
MATSEAMLSAASLAVLNVERCDDEEIRLREGCVAGGTAQDEDGAMRIGTAAARRERAAAIFDDFRFTCRRKGGNVAPG